LCRRLVYLIFLFTLKYILHRKIETRLLSSALSHLSADFSLTEKFQFTFYVYILFVRLWDINSMEKDEQDKIVSIKSELFEV